MASVQFQSDTGATRLRVRCGAARGPSRAGSMTASPRMIPLSRRAH